MSTLFVEKRNLWQSNPQLFEIKNAGQKKVSVAGYRGATKAERMLWEDFDARCVEAKSK